MRTVADPGRREIRRDKTRVFYTLRNGTPIFAVDFFTVETIWLERLLSFGCRGDEIDSRRPDPPIVIGSPEAGFSMGHAR
jgi:hypothetical protein